MLDVLGASAPSRRYRLNGQLGDRLIAPRERDRWSRCHQLEGRVG
ncbi:MAG: hypothetical protein ACRDRH_07530 [Pseudonocardia sp.]